MGNKWFADEVMEYLIERKNIEVSAAELMQHTGKKIGQVQGAINNLRRRKGAIIVSPVPGRVFVYQGIGQAQNVERENGSVVSMPMNAKPPEESPKPVRVVAAPALEEVAAKTEQRLKANPQNPPVVPSKPTGQFRIPKPHMDNEFMRVISRSGVRVILEDADGRIYKATEV